MAYSPKEIEEIMDNTIKVWETYAPDKAYGGITLDDLKALAAEAKKPRRRLERIAAERRSEIGKRKALDKTFMNKRAKVILGILADADEGDDSSFYGAMGYIRKSERKSGLTRKRVNGGTPNP